MEKLNGDIIGIEQKVLPKFKIENVYKANGKVTFEFPEAGYIEQDVYLEFEAELRSSLAGIPGISSIDAKQVLMLTRTTPIVKRVTIYGNCSSSDEAIEKIKHIIEDVVEKYRCKRSIKVRINLHT